MVDDEYLADLFSQIVWILESNGYRKDAKRVDDLGYEIVESIKEMQNDKIEIG